MITRIILIVGAIIILIVGASMIGSGPTGMTPAAPVAGTAQAQRHAAILAATMIDVRGTTLGALQASNRTIFADQDAEIVYHATTSPDGVFSFLAGAGVKKDYTLTVRGKVEALIDMGEFDPQRDLSIGEDAVARLVLPAVTLRATVDPQRSVVTLDSDSCLWVMCAGDRLDMLQGAAEQAPGDMITAASERGVILEAERTARDFYTALLKQAGVQVTVGFEGGN
jgi:hypothetical protein